MKPGVTAPPNLQRKGTVMENTSAINLLYVESSLPCQKPGCENPCVIMDTLTGNRFCAEHAPHIWLQIAHRNSQRIDAEIASIPSPCVVW